jgi:hypothetical protein
MLSSKENIRNQGEKKRDRQRILAGKFSDSFDVTIQEVCSLAQSSAFVVTDGQFPHCLT